MARTTANAVKGVLLSDYGKAADGSFPSLAPFIKAANLLVNRVRTCAINKNKALTADELTEIETWLAAHFYTKSDPTYLSRSTEGGSGQFARNPKVPEPYKDGALMLDSSGCLSAILNRQSAGIAWLGKTESEQIDYADRQ